MKLDYKKTFFVGLAFFAICMFWQTYDSVITKILIDKFGLNQTWSGVVMALDNVLALFMLPLFGGLSDKTNSKYGRRTPYIVVGTVLAAFAFIALSFADNYQTVKINETQIVEDYADYAHEKEVMQGSIFNSDGDTAMYVKYDKEEVTFLEYTTWQLEWAGYMVKWGVQNQTLKNEKDDLLAAGQLSQGAYDRWIANTYDVMTEAVTDGVTDGGLTQESYSYWSDEIYDGIYDVNLSEQAWAMTVQNPTTFIIFVIVLLIALVSMATFRSPAVALMPDVTIKPLRSKANAVINLMGTFGGILAIGILAVFSLDKLSYISYSAAFITVGILMIVFLVIFLWQVKEPKLVLEKIAEDEKYGLTEVEEKKPSEPVQELSKAKRTSLMLILFSVFLWFIGYNAVTTKFSDYAPKVLGMGYSLPLLIAQGAALIAFIPIGIIATKIGRRKTILMGIVVLSLCFFLASFIRDTGSGTTTIFMYAIFAFTGVGWATINVNSYPMVVELSKGSSVGKYTGFYYTFSMAAQIITPILSGVLMDLFGRKILFPYATLFVAVAFITMFFVKHGDAQIEKKGSTLEHFDVDMD
ncbi:MAG: MFS transporter [Candidatus Izemoplasmatales bacterium]|jgi:MFS family permease|nr:MFS transporter [Candidatus Izemoplasmatales bacterium]